MPCSRLFSEDRPLTNRGFGLTPVRSSGASGPCPLSAIQRPGGYHTAMTERGRGKKGVGAGRPVRYLAVQCSVSGSYGMGDKLTRSEVAGDVLALTPRPIAPMLILDPAATTRSRNPEKTVLALRFTGVGVGG